MKFLTISRYNFENYRQSLTIRREWYTKERLRGKEEREREREKQKRERLDVFHTSFSFSSFKRGGVRASPQGRLSPDREAWKNYLLQRGSKRAGSNASINSELSGS